MREYERVRKIALVLPAVSERISHGEPCFDTTGKHKVDWGEVASILEDAYRTVAPKALVAELDRTAG